VKTGANQPLNPESVERAIDPETLAELSAQTGLSREELLKRLAADIPQAVDKLTPNGEPPQGSSKGLLDDVPTRVTTTACDCRSRDTEGAHHLVANAPDEGKVATFILVLKLRRPIAIADD
jgi:hypothetical protein